MQRVIVPVGGTDREFLAQQQAVAFANALGVPVRAIHVATHSGDADADVFDYVMDACQRNGTPIQCMTLAGDDAAAELLLEVDALDLIVIGTRRLGTNYHVGSIAERLVRSAPCMVQVVRLEK